MDTERKLEILSDAAKYDVSCSSSGSSRANTPGGTGNACSAGICHSWSDDGRCISLLKILMSNVCTHDCAYCINRRSNDVPRASFTPKEVVDLTMNFYRRNYIEGLFLSSGVVGSADDTTARMAKVARMLRLEERFNGYIHMKIIPGTDPLLIAEIGRWADRVSINIELPTEGGLALLAPQKSFAVIHNTMALVKAGVQERQSLLPALRRKERFVPAGQTTQMIIGAPAGNLRESDAAILRKAQWLYDEMALKRVYYSAYVPVNHNPQNGPAPAVPLTREHRIYQADWLLRFYKFRAEELFAPEEERDFDLDIDPKADWALHHFGQFPLEVNRAPYEMLLRVPGIGVTSALRIVRARKLSRLHYDDLQKIGVVMKRAKHFLLADGVYQGGGRSGPEEVRRILTVQDADIRQTSLFDKEVAG